MSRLVLFGVSVLASFCLAGRVHAETVYEFGFGKADITPTVPLRLSGYGGRSEVAEGIDEQLFVRAMAIKPPGGQLAVLVSVDTIGLPGVLTKSIAERVAAAHGIPRSRFVLACTHSHTAPHVSPGLTNLFAVPMTDDQTKDSTAYTARLADQVVHSVAQAVGDLKPARLFTAEGAARFAHNRRVVQNGQWSGFGERPEGPTDHALPVLKITDADGALRGVVFNYACHCTTFGGNYNRVNGDWAGYAAKYIEEAHPGATALCTIGCGGDQNPERDENAEAAMRLATSHGREIAIEVDRLIAGEVREITADLAASFGYAGLPVDRPSIDDLKKALEDRQPQVRQHAQNMLAVHERMGRLPETYPAPLQVWRFGDELCMVFLSGEVVVDYSMRLKREIKSSLVWVSAYANDVYGYLASERVRREGGYEVSSSMIYYNQPGAWAEGTEEVVVRRVHELVEEGSFAGPFTPEEALGTFRLPEGFKIAIVAAEPLIADPVNFAVGADGRLWVVEMGDYPRGEDGQEKPGGRVKVLDDTDADGRYDKCSLFLDGLSYPNGVFPWRDGVLVSGAPAILFARDINGDDRADEVKELYAGFDEANPQHRVNGFAYGLDNWLYLAGGADNGEVNSSRTGQTVDIGSQDFRIQPDKGLIGPVGGHTQHGRNRDDWGNWFGGDNSHPFWHYVIPDRYVARNPYVSTPDLKVHLYSPPFAPPVFPASRTLDRFNDLFALDRFTSACSPIAFRDESFGPDFANAAFVSEPVHNLVHRAILVDDGVTFRATRHVSEGKSEFLASTDHWFRPTALATGPDGALWVADMYRQVIEHPEWIPEAWQAQLDLRAGSDRGRIYRVYRSDPVPLPNVAKMTALELLEELSHANGWRRDTAQRLLVERGEQSVIGKVEAILQSSIHPAAKLHALGVLQGLESLTAGHVLAALADRDPRVARHAILLSEPFLNEDPSLGRALVGLVDHPDKRLRLQLALSLGEWDHADAADALVQLALADVGDAWMRVAVLCSARRHAGAMLAGVLGRGESAAHSQLVQDLIATALSEDEGDRLGAVLDSITKFDDAPDVWQIAALASLDRALRRKDMSLAKLSERTPAEGRESLEKAGKVVEAARRLVADREAPLEVRLAALPLVGRGAARQWEDVSSLAGLLSPQEPVALQLACVGALSEFDQDEIAGLFLSNWRQLSPQVQSEVLSAMLARRTWHIRLLDALQAGEVQINDLNAAVRTRLQSAEDEFLRGRADKLLARASVEDRSEVLERFRSVAELSGDASRGAAKFQATCAACHRHQEIGNNFGPQLAALSDKSDEALLIAILDPNRAIENKYKSYTCVTADGRTLSGMITAESASSVTLAQTSGTEQVLLRVDIEELSSTGVSFMPVGLEKDLSPQDLADLFTFIRQDARE
jgi:putative membrane-bound dehydrogenase-like protein